MLMQNIEMVWPWLAATLTLLGVGDMVLAAARSFMDPNQYLLYNLDMLDWAIGVLAGMAFIAIGILAIVQEFWIGTIIAAAIGMLILNKRRKDYYFARAWTEWRTREANT
jgi:hypothetical protein